MKKTTALYIFSALLLSTLPALAQVPLPPPPPPPPSSDDCLYLIMPCPLNEIEADTGLSSVGSEASSNDLENVVGPEDLIAATPSASPMPFFAVGDGAGDGSSNFFRFSFFGGITDFTSIGETGTILWDIAINPNISYLAPLYAISQTGWLYSVNQSTGAKSYIGSTGYSLNALEFCNGVLYGWGSSYFVVINPNNGQVTFARQVSYGSSGDLMCSPSGELYGIAKTSNNDALVIFNTTTGYNSFVATLPGVGFFGGEFDGMGQMFLGRKTGSGIQLYHVDPITFVSTVVGYRSTSFGLNGLATFPAVW